MFTQRRALNYITKYKSILEKMGYKCSAIYEPYSYIKRGSKTLEVPSCFYCFEIGDYSIDAEKGSYRGLYSYIRKISSRYKSMEFEFDRNIIYAYIIHKPDYDEYDTGSDYISIDDKEKFLRRVKVWLDRESTLTDMPLIMR